MRSKPYLPLFSVTLWLCSTAMVAAMPQREMRYRHRSKPAAQAWQKQLRQDLFDNLLLQDLAERSHRCALLPAKVAEQASAGYHMMHMEIQATPGRRIPVLLTRPSQGPGPFPAVVCVHGHGGDRRSVYDAQTIYKGFAAQLAASGYVTIAADVGQHVISESGRTLMGERLLDLIRCVDYLDSLEYVDGNRLGCAGLSLGGEMAMWLAAMDERIAATVSAGFLTMMDQMEKNHCPCWKFPGLRERVDWPDVYSLIAPRWLQCQNGRQEPAQDFTVALAQRAMKEIKIIYQDYGCAYHVQLQVHDGGHEVDLAALLHFFAQTIGRGR